MQRLLAVLVSIGLVVTSAANGVAAATGAAATSGALMTVPTLRTWSPGGTGYTFEEGAKVVAPAGLSDTARTFAHDLKALTGVDVPVVQGSPADGDIVLRKASAPGDAEGYRMSVGPRLVLEGNTGDGVFHGTRTVLQLLRQNRTLPGGTATDWPRYRERGLLLDLGRQYMSVSWLKQRIRELSYLKLNQLHLHLSDRPGFRLESTRHPEITADQHYTKQQMRELIDYADRYHVRIVPEIDMPGHMDAILAQHPELRLVSRSGEVDPGGIDLSKPAAYELMRDLLEEYLELFPGEYWHIGADEYVTNYADYPQLEAYAKEKYGPEATGKDAYYGYMNWANDIVRAAGKTGRMWNDGYKPGGSTITVDPDIVVGHWSANGPGGVPWFGDAYNAPQLAARGHRVFNVAHRPLTYTTGGPGAFDNSHPLEMYHLWDPSRFVDGARLDDTTRNLGAMYQLWCDESTKTEAQLAEILHYRLRVFAQRAWRTPSPALYVQFIPVMNAVGDAPAAARR